MKAYIYPCTLNENGECVPIPDKTIRLNPIDLGILIQTIEINGNPEGAYLGFINFQLKLVLAINKGNAPVPHIEDIMMQLLELLQNEHEATHVAWYADVGIQNN